jgi:hypothetical protein
MTADHLTAAQKAVSALIPGDFDNTGWDSAWRSSPGVSMY